MNETKHEGVFNKRFKHEPSKQSVETNIARKCQDKYRVSEKEIISHQISDFDKEKNGSIYMESESFPLTCL